MVPNAVNITNAGSFVKEISHIETENIQRVSLQSAPVSTPHSPYSITMAIRPRCKHDKIKGKTTIYLVYLICLHYE